MKIGNLKKLLSAAVIAGMLAMTMAAGVSAATGSAITSVSIRVSVNMNSGDKLPGITTGEGSGDGAYVSVSSSKYEVDDAQWITSDTKDMTIGEQPRMKVTLRPTDSSSWYFKGSYKASNVTVKGGTFVSANKSGNNLQVILRVSGVKGQYDPPEDAYWKDSGYGKAYWKKGEITSNAYDVYLYKGNSIVKKLEGIKVTNYDFYPYMTKVGSYSFKVRTVPYTEEEKKYGKKSEWTESDEFYISEETVSDGSGQLPDGMGNGNWQGITQVGWIQDGSTWYYRYPDGSYQKNSWLKINERWYLFDTNGKMMTGWQQRNSQWYFLNPDGSMYTGWLNNGNKWYYLNQTPGDQEGIMCKNVWINQNGMTYYMNTDGIMVEGWQKVGEDWYYFYPGSGHKAVNTYIDSFYVDANGIWRK